MIWKLSIFREFYFALMNNFKKIVRNNPDDFFKTLFYIFDIFNNLIINVIRV